MRFRAEHEFDVPPGEVASALVDPAFYESLELPDVGPAELVSHRPPEGGAAAGSIVVRYEYTGSLDPLVQSVLRGARLTWTQELRLHREPANRGELEIHADMSPSLLHARAEVRLDPAGGRGARRVIEGDFVVSLPGLGRIAERRIVPGVLHRLDVEAESLGHWLA